MRDKQNPKLADIEIESLFRYMEEQGCFTLAMVVLVESCHVFDCGNRGQLPDESIQLCGYEVNAVACAYMVSGKAERVNLYYHTKSAAECDLALQILSKGSVLLVKVSYLNFETPLTLYLDNLASVTTLPAGLADAMRWLLERGEHSMGNQHD